MTDQNQILCPVCGSKAIVPLLMHIPKSQAWQSCLDCQSKWPESKRRPANVVAWEYLCECIANANGYIGKLPDGTLDVGLIAEDLDDDGDEYGEFLFELSEEALKVLGWQSMPPVSRGEVG